MPLPRNKRHPKRKPKRITDGSEAGHSHDLEIDIPNDVQVSWVDLLPFVTKELHLPDIDTTSGLKKIHKEFEQVSKTLDEFYEVAKATQKYKPLVAASVVGVYAKLCSDSVLLRRVILETKYTQMVAELLPRPFCGMLIASLLWRVVCHCEDSIHHELATRLTGTILDILENPRTNQQFSQLLTGILSTWVKPQSQHPQFQHIDIDRLIRVYVNVSTKRGLMIAVAPFFCDNAHILHDHYLSHPKVLDIIVSLIRSPNFHTRTLSFRGIKRYHLMEAEEENLGVFEMSRITSMFREPWPPELERELNACGIERLETMIVVQALGESSEAMKKVFRDHDFYAHGKTLVPLVLRTEYSIGISSWGDDEIRRTNFPCKTYVDTLLQAANAVRTRATPENGEAWMADVLEVKYLLAVSQDKAAAALCARCIKNYPDIGFFYYVIAKEEESTKEAVRLSKIGLRCPNLTPYVRLNLLYNSAMNASLHVQETLISPDKPARADANKYALIAFEDAAAYLREAPPDSRALRRTIYIYIHMLLVLRGHELTLSSPELVEAKRKLNNADWISRSVSQPISKSYQRLICLTYLSRLDSAWASYGQAVLDWEAIITKNPAPDLDQFNLESGAAWLESSDKAEKRDGGAGDLSELDSQANLSRCNWCRALSVKLKKCKGDCPARYCDADCQKQDWKNHKKTCVNAQAPAA